MISDDEPGPLSAAARRLIPALVLVWIVAGLVSLARRDGQPAGDCTFGVGVGLVGLVMLAKDQWPGKRMIDFRGGGDRQPLSGWYGRSGPAFLAVVGTWLAVGVPVKALV